MKTVTPQDCQKKYGNPETEKFMVLWIVPKEFTAAIPTIPQRIYCNKDMVLPLMRAFENIVSRGFSGELKTWDGCFNIRKMVGIDMQSLHSWGIAVDVNAAWNGLGAKPTLSAGFVKCFTDAGFEWGGKWKRKDGMHFQPAKI